jgi:putative lipase involved disintegration of autophagic bodies
VENCVFAFRGSDDVQDWLSNAAGIFGFYTYGNWHGGFHDEFQKIRPMFEARVNACVNPVFVGHSLGGSIATVAQDYYNKGSVVTFGAPLTFDNNPGCHVPGKRIFHEEDPVAGNLFGAMSSYFHGTPGTEIYEDCKRRSWLGWCTESRYTTRDVDCQRDSGWFDRNVGAHSLNGEYKNQFQSQTFW